MSKESRSTNGETKTDHGCRRVSVYRAAAVLGRGNFGTFRRVGYLLGDIILHLDLGRKGQLPTQSPLIHSINRAEIVKNFTNFLAAVPGGD